MTCKKANNALSFLRRNLYHCQRKVKVDAYQTYVRPILEYAATVWAPYTQRNISKLESIQCRVARFVMGDFATYSSDSMLSKGYIASQKKFIKVGYVVRDRAQFS